MGLTFEQETLASILAEQRRTNELLEALLAAFVPAEGEERDATPPQREKQKCPKCRATFTRASGALDPCPHCGTEVPSSKRA